MYAMLSAFDAAMQLPDRVAFRLGNFSIQWYGLFLAAAILVTIVFAALETRRKSLPADTAVDVCLVAIPCGVVGARLVYVLLNLSLYRGDLGGVFRLWDGGLSITGALLFAVIGVAVYAARKKLSLLRILDTVAPGLVLAQALVLWGDFFNQTDYGPFVEKAGQKWFPLAVRIEETGTIHFAVFFYEFLWCLLVFALLFFVLRKRLTRDGQMLGVGLLLYCPAHIVFEALREDGAYLFGNVKISEAVCVLLIVYAVLLLVRAARGADAADADAEAIDEKPADETTDAAAAPAEDADAPDTEVAAPAAEPTAAEAEEAPADEPATGTEAESAAEVPATDTKEDA